MNLNKLLLLSIFLLLLSSFASAVTDSHGYTLPSSATNSVVQGVKIIPNYDINLSYFTKNSLSVSTGCAIYNDTAGLTDLTSSAAAAPNLIATGSFSGNDCVFSGGVKLLKGNSYALIVGTWVSHTHYYRGPTTSILPVNTTNVLFASGRQSAAEYTNFILEVISVTSEIISETTNNFTITTKSIWDNSTINTFNATINGTDYNTTTGTIITDIPNNSTSLYNITVFADDWFNNTYNNYNVSSNLEAQLKQSQINISPLELITNNTISNFTAYLNGTIACNVTGSSCIIYPNSGIYTVTIEDNTGTDDFHTTSNTLNVTALDNTTFNPRIHQHQILVYARTINNATINNFSATISSLNITDIRTQNTTTGLVNFDAIHNDYNITVDAPGYALINNTATVTVGSGSFNYTVYVYLYTTNSVNISIYDSNTLQLLNGTNVTVEFIGATAQTNITSTGTLFVDLLNPSEYTIISSATGYRQGSYIFTLTNRSFTEIDLYLDNTSTTSLALITVIDKYSKDPIPNSLLTIQRYINNTWKTEQIVQTDFNGQAEAWFVVSTEFYNILVSKDGTTYFGVINSNENKKVIYAEDIANGITIEIDTNPNEVISNYQSTYSVATSLNFYNTSNSTGYFTFYWDDSDNVNRDGELIVTLNNNVNCTKSSTGETGSLTCNIAISDSSQITVFVANGYIDGQLVETRIGILGTDAALQINWGITGWFISIMLVIIGFTLFLSLPKVGVLFGTLIFVFVIGFNLVLENTSISVLVGVITMALVLLKIPRKEGE